MLTAYYNEIDPYAAQWLRNLIAAGHVAPGDVDERSIRDVRAADLAGYRQCHFFAGIGGWSVALKLAGWPDDRPVWTGSCPCQPFSSAGKSGGGGDPRHLWPAWHRLIRECRPPVLFGEQVEAAVGHGWLDLVCDDLEREGYAVGAVGLPAASVGAPHIRQRLWFVADATSERYGRASEPSRPSPYRLQSVSGNGASEQLADAIDYRTRRPSEAQSSGDGSHDGVSRTDGATHQLGDTDQSGSQGHRRSVAEHDKAGRQGTERYSAATGAWDDLIWLPCRDGKARPTQPGLQPLAHGVSARVGRLRGYGNAIVPQVAAEVIRAYMGSVEEALAL